MTTAAIDHEVAVIGCGIGGVALGYYLKQAQIDNFVIYEKSDNLGGTWHLNTYPGVACDIPSIVYQYSFACNPDWSRVFAPGAEIQAYTQDVADRFGITSHVRCNREITRQVWDEENHLWELHFTDGDIRRTRFLVTSLGPFVRPKPAADALPGIDLFEGRVLQTADWDNDFNVEGKRVGVIGTGASGVQVSAAIASEVSTLSVFQRTAGWVGPKIDFTVPRALRFLQRIPGTVQVIRGSVLLVGHFLTLVVFARWFAAPLRWIMRHGGPLSVKVYRAYIRSRVNDPAVAEALVPPYGIGTQRPTLSVNFHRIFNQPNVKLVTAPIERVVPEGILTADGHVHELDAIVTAIGWESSASPATYVRGSVLGANGADLGTFFAENGAQAFEGVAVPDFPNRWMLVGPNSWQGNGGWHALVELGAKHAVRAISLARSRSATRTEVRREVHDRQHAIVRQRAQRFEYYFNTVYPNASRSWIINEHGEFAIAKPYSVWRNYWLAKRFPQSWYSYERMNTAAAQQCSSRQSEAIGRRNQIDAAVRG